MANTNPKADEMAGVGKAAVRSCNCTCRAQDKIHSIGRRVHNRAKTGWRCSGCGELKKV